MDNAEPVTDIFFPKLPPPSKNRIHMHMEALSYGKLELKDKCIGFKGEDGFFLTFIAWPSIYDLIKIDDELYIVSNNKPVVKIGEYLKMGGGHGRASEAEFLVSNGVQCPPPYWVVGRLTIPSIVERITYKLRLMEWI